MMTVFNACEKEPTIDDYIDQIVGVYKGKRSGYSSNGWNSGSWEQDNYILNVERVDGSNERIRSFETGGFSREYTLETVELPVTYDVWKMSSMEKGKAMFHVDHDSLELTSSNMSPGGSSESTFQGIKIN